MKKFFYIGVALAVLFEAANVYFIMPMPYSQRVRSIDLAYFLYTWRWLFRGAFGLMIVGGIASAWSTPSWRKALVPLSLIVVACIAYMANFVMAADHMFLQPTSVVMRPATANSVEPSRLVVGIVNGTEARAYPVQFIGYHHQIRDSIGGEPVLVSFCTVCRTGRVFSPSFNGKLETFRLVGMDHFNAMFEDRTTRSWWRQATGEAVAGPLKGKALAELPSLQVTLAQWLAIHPNSLIMQPDPALQSKYSKSFDYETGASKSTLTGTDTISWHDKAWVVGVSLDGESKAYDWNRLRREKVVNDHVGRTPIVLALAADRVSFFVYERPDDATRFTLRGDSLVALRAVYPLGGDPLRALKPVPASQEFWHSWRTFHPETTTY